MPSKYYCEKITYKFRGIKHTNTVFYGDETGAVVAFEICSKCDLKSLVK